MLAVTVVAVCVVTLLYANYFVAGAIRFFTALALSLAIVAAVYVSGKWRAFWVGFAIVGWIQFLIGVLDSVRPFNRGISQQSLSALYELVASADSGIAGPAFAGFAIILHCIVTAMVAMLGGYVAMRFDARRQPPVARAK
jgi:hypothetical protein